MMHYDALADGAGYFKKNKEGRRIMCEAVEKYGDERELHGSVSANANAVRNLMLNLKLSIDQALDMLGLQGEERNAVLKQLLK